MSDEGEEEAEEELGPNLGVSCKTLGYRKYRAVGVCLYPTLVLSSSRTVND